MEDKPIERFGTFILHPGGNVQRIKAQLTKEDAEALVELEHPKQPPEPLP